MTDLKSGTRVTHKADRTQDTWHRGTVEVVQTIDGVLHARVQWDNQLTASLHPVANLDRWTP